MNVRHWLILLISLSLIGCASVKPVETVTTSVSKTPLALSPADPVRVSPVRWIVITPENAEEVFESLRSSGVEPVLIALTDDGYKELALSLAEIRTHMINQRIVVLAYKKYYESEE